MSKHYQCAVCGDVYDEQTPCKCDPAPPLFRVSDDNGTDIKVEKAGDGTKYLDEFYSENVASVHVERMADSHIWMQVDLVDETSLRFSFWSKGKVRAMVEKD